MSRLDATLILLIGCQHIPANSIHRLHYSHWKVHLMEVKYVMIRFQDHNYRAVEQHRMLKSMLEIRGCDNVHLRTDPCRSLSLSFIGTFYKL